MASANQSPGGYKFAQLVTSQQGRANQHEPACFGLSFSWPFPSCSGIPLHAVVQPWFSKSAQYCRNYYYRLQRAVWRLISSHSVFISSLRCPPICCIAVGSMRRTLCSKMFLSRAWRSIHKYYMYNGKFQQNPLCVASCVTKKLLTLPGSRLLIPFFIAIQIQCSTLHSFWYTLAQIDTPCSLEVFVLHSTAPLTTYPGTDHEGVSTCTTRMYSSSAFCAQNPALEIIHQQKSVNVYTYIHTCTTGMFSRTFYAQHPVSPKDIHISPRFSSTIFNRDANSVLVRVHLCTALGYMRKTLRSILFMRRAWKSILHITADHASWGSIILWMSEVRNGEQQGHTHFRSLRCIDKCYRICLFTYELCIKKN